MPQVQVVLPQTQQSLTLTDEEAADGCEYCNHTGYYRVNVPVKHPHFGKLFLCECQRSRAEARLTRISRLSPEMQGWTLDNFSPRKGKLDVRPVIEEVLKMGYGWLTLSGPYGVGKTHLLAAIANDARSRGEVVVYTTIADLLDDLRATFHPKAEETYSQLFEDVRGCQVLCIDEVEKFSTTPWALEKFQQLIEHRYRNWALCLTVFATNTPVKNIGNWQGETLPGYMLSRINDGRFWVVDQFWNVSDVRPALKRKEQ